jgi:hypothetical protein
VKPSFTVERVDPRDEPRIQKACENFKVVRFKRSGHAIQVVSGIGAVLRF